MNAKKRPGLFVFGVAIVVGAIIGAVAIAMIKPMTVAIAMTAIVVLVVIAIGLLPRAMQKRAAARYTTDQP